MPVADQIHKFLSDTLPPGVSLEDLGESVLKEVGKSLEEGARRENDEQIRYYKPFDDPGYQKDFHSSTAKTRLAVGSNRSGKTTVGVAECIWWAMGTHPYRKTPKPPVRIRACGVDFEKGIEQTMLPKYKEFVRREDLKDGSWENAYSKMHRVLHFKNKSFVEFMSYDQDVEKFGGTSRHFIHEDEPAPRDIHNENQARLIDTKGETIMTLTPVNLSARTSWIFDLWREASEGKNLDLKWFFFDIFKNRSLSKEYIEKFKASISESEQLARIEGKFPQLAGLVFKNFSRAKHIIKEHPIPEHWTRYVGIDPHTREKTAVLFCAVDPEGNVYVYDEIFEVGTGKVLVQFIKSKVGKDKIECFWMDNAAKDPNEILGTSVWQEFVDPERDGSDKGIFAVTVSNKQEAHNVKIRVIKDLLGLDAVYQKPKIFFLDNCPMTIHEMETAIYEDYKSREEKPLKERIRKKGIHFIDCLGFVVIGGATYVKLRSPEDSQYKSPYPYLNKYAGN